MTDALSQKCANMFGISASYVPDLANRPELNGAPIAIRGIFTDIDETVPLMGGGFEHMETVVPRPVLEIQARTLGVDPMDGDEIVLGGKTYLVSEVQKRDHMPTIKLFLKRVR